MWKLKFLNLLCLETIKNHKSSTPQMMQYIFHCFVDFFLYYFSFTFNENYFPILNGNFFFVVKGCFSPASYIFLFVLFCYQRKNSFREIQKKSLQAVFNDNIFIQCEFKLYTKFKYSVSLKYMGIRNLWVNLMEKKMFLIYIKSSYL